MTPKPRIKEKGLPGADRSPFTQSVTCCNGRARGDKQGPFKSQYPYLDENSLEGLLKCSHYPEEEEKQNWLVADPEGGARTGKSGGPGGREWRRDRGQCRTLGRGGVAGGKDLRTSGKSGKVPGGEGA